MIFGNKTTFAIECRMLYGNELPEDWGCIYFWVNGRNLFAFKESKPAETYHWYIFMFVEWLCENLSSLMNRDDFPVEIDAPDAFDFKDEINKVIGILDEDSQESFNLRCERNDWIARHCFLISRGGSFAHDMYIRSYKDKIEIVWDSKQLYAKEGVEFLYPEGLEYVSREAFFAAAVQFLQYYCDLPEKQGLDSNIKLKQILEKTIETVVV